VARQRRAADGEVRDAALSQPRGRAHEVGALLERDVRRGIGGGIVCDDDTRVRERLPQRPQRVPEPIRLVPGSDDYRGHAGYRGGPSYQEVVSLPDVEAHITGTVWKVECQVGQSVEEGDTLVILESMKMEMPVEAEDDGTVKEIKCEEGQSVSEGDTLVVLE
jgi:acetyl-CoA carboxylase biotin carboxyl carrier protein